MAGLTAAQKQQYEEAGHVTVEGILTQAEVETLRRACSEVEEMAQGLTARTPAIQPRILPLRPPRGGHCQRSRLSASSVPGGLHTPRRARHHRITRRPGYSASPQ